MSAAHMGVWTGLISSHREAEGVQVSDGLCPVPLSSGAAEMNVVPALGA